MSHIKVEFAKLQVIGKECSATSKRILQAKEDFQSSINKLDWEVKSKANIRARVVKLYYRLNRVGIALPKCSFFINTAYSRYAELDNYKNGLDDLGDVTQFSSNKSVNVSVANKEDKYDEKKQNGFRDTSNSIDNKDNINDQNVDTQIIDNQPTPSEDYETKNKIITEIIIDKLREAKNAKEKENEVAQQEAFEELKSYIKLSDNTTLDDKIYKAFLDPIVEILKNSKISEYDSKVSHGFVKQLGNAIFNGLQTISDQTVRVGKTTYTIHYDMNYAQQGLTTVIATIKWKEGGATKSTQMTLTNIGTKNGAKALAEYSYGLAKLNKDVWMNAATEFVSVGLAGITDGKTLVANKKATEIAKKLVIALSDDAVAEAFAAEIGGATQSLIHNEGKNYLFNTAKYRLKKLIKEYVPGGKDIVQLAESLGNLEKELKTYEHNIDVYKNNPNKINKTTAAYWTISNNVDNLISKF